MGTDLLYWKWATGGWPWTHANKSGKYVIIEDYDEKTGRFKGALNIPINDVLGLTDRKIMEYQLVEKDKRIKQLEVEKKQADIEKKYAEMELNEIKKKTVI